MILLFGSSCNLFWQHIPMSVDNLLQLQNSSNTSISKFSFVEGFNFVFFFVRFRKSRKDDFCHQFCSVMFRQRRRKYNTAYGCRTSCKVSLERILFLRWCFTSFLFIGVSLRHRKLFEESSWIPTFTSLSSQSFNESSLTSNRQVSFLSLSIVSVEHLPHDCCWTCSQQHTLSPSHGTSLISNKFPSFFTMKNFWFNVFCLFGISFDSFQFLWLTISEPSRKRRRNESIEEEELWHRDVIRKLEEKRKKIDSEEKFHYRVNKDLNEMFNNLQAISAEYCFFICFNRVFSILSLIEMISFQSLNITFETPELVVVGMQSDGKSSFIEGLLGFQFNIVDTSTCENSRCISFSSSMKTLDISFRYWNSSSFSYSNGSLSWTWTTALSIS